MRIQIFILCLCTTIVSYSQQGDTLSILADSISTMLNSGHTTEIKNLARAGKDLARDRGSLSRELEFTYYLGSIYFNLDLDSGIYFLEDGLKKADQTSDKIMQSKFLNALGNFYRKKGNYVDALGALNRGLKIVEKSDHPRRDQYLASFRGKLGALYKDLGDYEKSLQYQLATIKIWERGEDLRRMAITYNDIGLLFRYLKNEGASIANFRESLALARQTQNRSLESKVLANMAEVYLQRDQLDTARDLLRKSIEIKQQQGLNDFETKLSLATLLIRQGESADAGTILTDIEGSSQESVNWSIGYLLARARYFILLNDLKIATRHADSARDIAERVGNDYLLRESVVLLSEIYENRNNFERANSFLKEARVLSEKLLNEENVKASENARILYETSKKEAEIRELTQTAQIQDLLISKRNVQLTAVAAGLSVLLVLGFVLYRQKLVKRERETLELRQRLLRIQLNPHFLFNSLSAIQSMVYKGAETVKTADYLAKFSQLTRQILELNEYDQIGIREEVDFIENYLSIQQVRFDKPFSFEVEVDEELFEANALIPPMISQPFLENAIEHGIIEKHGDGNVYVSFRIEKDQLVVRIEDNGVGRERSAFQKKINRHRSLATQITENRLAILSRSTRQKADMEITDVVCAELICGTLVTFTLPLIVEE